MLSRYASLMKKKQNKTNAFFDITNKKTGLNWCVTYVCMMGTRAGRPVVCWLDVLRPLEVGHTIVVGVREAIGGG